MAAVRATFDEYVYVMVDGRLSAFSSDLQSKDLSFRTACMGRACFNEIILYTLISQTTHLLPE